MKPATLPTASRGNPGNLDKESSPAFPAGGRGLPAQLGRASPSGREGGKKRRERKRREGKGEGEKEGGGERKRGRKKEGERRRDPGERRRKREGREE